MVKKGDALLITLSFLLALLVIGLFAEDYYKPESITGMATTANAQTSASIANYFAINKSTNMTSDGILFIIPSLPVLAANATANYDSNSQTQLFLTVEVDSNVNVDFCIKANDSLRSGANFVALGNYTFSNSTINNLTRPTMAAERALVSNIYLNSTRNIAPGSAEYYRFWLDVPGTQASGTYINTVNFKGVQTENACN